MRFLNQPRPPWTVADLALEAVCFLVLLGVAAVLLWMAHDAVIRPKSR